MFMQSAGLDPILLLNVRCRKTAHEAPQGKARATCEVDEEDIVHIAASKAYSNDHHEQDVHELVPTSAHQLKNRHLTSSNKETQLGNNNL